MATTEMVLGAIAVASNDTDWPSRGTALVRQVNDLQQVSAELKDALIKIACGLQEAHLSLMGVFMATAPYLTMADPALADLILELKGLACRPTDSVDETLRRFEAVARVHKVIEESYRAGLAVPRQDALFKGVEQALLPPA